MRRTRNVKTLLLAITGFLQVQHALGNITADDIDDDVNNLMQTVEIQLLFHFSKKDKIVMIY